MKNNIKNKKFSLVLSGGGALGIAHLGVIHDLEELGIYPSEVVGTSMGGIIAACVAIGMSEEEIYEQVKSFAGISNWVKFSFSGNAIINHEKIAIIFQTIFGEKKMADTQIPLKLITTNLLNGDKRVFDASDDVYIKDALLATMAIPGVFQEHQIDDEVYGDGFLCENLGISEATCDDIIAVDVMGQNAFDKAMPDNFFKTSNVLEMFEKSVRLLIYNQSKAHMKNSNKNIYLIEPKTFEYKTFEFHKIDEIRALGMGLLTDMMP